MFYFSDDGDLTALRYNNWKLVFMEQRDPGTLSVWTNPFTPQRVSLIFNLRRDSYEFAQITFNTYYWVLDHTFLLVPEQDIVGEFLMTFKEYPLRRMKAVSFSLNKVMEQLYIKL